MDCTAAKRVLVTIRRRPQHVVSYFNYVNRVADGLGVQLERDWPPEQRRRRRYPGPDLPFPAVAADSVP